METDKELTRLRDDVEVLRSSLSSMAVTVAATHAVTEQKFTYLTEMTDELKFEINKTTTAIEDLKTIALKGETSLKLILWIGAFLAGLIGVLSVILDAFKS